MNILKPHIKQADYQRTNWAVTPPAGAELKTLLTPEAWVHVAPALRPRDILEVMPEDGEWYAVLIVRSNGPKGPQLAVLSHTQFAPAKPAEGKATEEGPYEVKFAGGDKWRVTRRADNEVLAKGLQSREAANAWVSEHLTELA